MVVPGAVPAEVRLSNLLYKMPRTTLDGSAAPPFAEVEAALRKVGEPTNGVVEPKEVKSILDWHAIKCTNNDLNEICRQCRAGDGLKIDISVLLQRLKDVHDGKLKVVAPKVTVQQLRKRLESLIHTKFTHLFKAFKSFDTDGSGDITAEEFRLALADHNFIMDDETFEMFCSDWMDRSNASKLNVTGNINYEAFKRKYGGAAVAGGKDQFMSQHDAAMRNHLEKLHARDKYTSMKFATAQTVITELKRLLSSRFGTVLEAFQAFDENRSGAIDVTEFQRALERFSNLRMRDEEYQNLSRHFGFNLIKPLNFQEFKIAFGNLIAGSPQKKTMADRNEASLAAHRVKVQRNADRLEKQTFITASNATKQFAAKLGNKFDKLRVAFNSMDRDNSGAIEPDELRSVLLGYNLRMSDEEWSKFMNSYTLDEYGRINREVFYKKFGPVIKGDYGNGGPGHTNAAERAAAVKKAKNAHVTHAISAELATKKLKEIIAAKYDDIRKAFLTMDRDNSGEIEATEFRRALKQFNLEMTDTEFEKFVKTNGLGNEQKINFSKFQKKFAGLITGEFQGHDASDTHAAAMKNHRDKVMGRQGIMPIKLEESLMHKEKASKLHTLPPKKAPVLPLAGAITSPQQSEGAPSPVSVAPVAKPKSKPKAPVEPSKPVRFMSLLDAIAKLEILLGKKARKLPAALIAMDLEATSHLKPDECRRVLAQFGINVTPKDFRQLCKLYDCWEDSGLCNYVALAKGFGADLAQRVYDVSPMKKASDAKVVADAKVALKEGQEYLLDKLRNSYEKVVQQLEHNDRQLLGYVTAEDFVAVLARHAAVRLTKPELAAFCEYYNKPSLRFDNRAATRIDYKKFSKLFDPLRHPVDYSNPTVMAKFAKQNVEAEAYLRDKLRNAYPKVLRAFKSLIQDDKDHPGVDHASFRRMLSRFGAVRMTNSEWDGFISKYDANHDGFISFDELKVLFQDFAARDWAAAEKAARAREQVVIDRTNRRQRAKEVEQILIGPPVPVGGAEDLLAVHFQNKLNAVHKTFTLLDREGNGMLPRDDFQRACARTGFQLTTREMDALASKYDPENQCRVEIEAFIATMRKKIAVLQATSVNPVRVKRLFKSVQELITFKYKTADQAFAAFDANKTDCLESNEWLSVFEALGLQVTTQERTALAKFLDTKTDGDSVVLVAFRKFWKNLPGTPATELARTLETWARRSGGKTSQELFQQAESSFKVLDGQNERALPLLEFVAALSAAGIRFDNAEIALIPFKQGTRYSYILFLKRLQSVLDTIFSKWNRGPTRGPGSAAGRRPTTSRVPSSSNRANRPSASRGPSRQRSREEGSSTPTGSLPRIKTGSSRAPQPTSRPMTSRTLPDARRAALEAKLRKAQLGKTRSPKTARATPRGPADGGPSPAANVDFETALFACWKKLRALFVAADKSRTGRLPQKAVVAILQRNHVGSSPDEARAKTKSHSDDRGVNYNAFIKSVLQSRSR